MKVCLTIILLLVFTISLLSISLIDSLENKLDIVVAEEKVKVLNALSNEYLYISPKQAIYYGDQAAELAKSFRDDMNEYKAYVNIANSYSLLRNYEKGIEYFEKALKKSEAIGDVEYILKDIYRIADAYSSNKNSMKAIEYYNKALKINEITNKRNEVALTLNRIGLEYKKTEDYKKASEYFIKALRFEEENVRVLMRDEYKQISEFYTLRGEDEKALKYYKLFTSIKDTITSEERSNTISDMQNRYDSEQRKRRIELLQKEKEIKDLELTQLTLTQQKKEKEYETKQRVQQIEALQREKELKEAQLKTAELARENIQKKIDAYQRDKEIRELELEKRDMQIRSQSFIQKVLITASIMIFIFAVISTILFIANRKKNKELSNAYSKLEHIAKTDPLTGLSNRRDMIEKLEHEQKRFGRNGKSFVLLMSDIDDFKKINDAHGHDSGDFILGSLAKQMQSLARKQDITGRWGGEEFLMMLPETDIEGGFSLAEKIRNDIETSTYIYNDIELTLTMTFGVSVYNRPMDIDHCIKMADEALYKGKNQGKNCVVITKPEDNPLVVSVEQSAKSV
ncbi:MAG: diguanylate cyclase [Candidatus Cloacimonetes bacterium]|nr:diguanylate cyclase [Candidatus Cloacimonadota bacterium]